MDALGSTIAQIWAWLGTISVQFALAVFVGASFGCAAPRNPFVDQDPRIGVEIRNGTSEVARLNALWPGQRFRLETVPGNTTATYMLPLARNVLLRFLINVSGRPRCVPREIVAYSGDIIVLEIDPRFLDDPDCLRSVRFALPPRS
jgi:hypothetical protein